MAAPTETVLGIIGGSGLYEMEALTERQWVSVDTPFGPPSDQLLCGVLDGVKMVFLPRHGRGHKESPTSINYRANIDALKRCGVTDILSVSACGGLEEALTPGTFVLVEQFIDRTFARDKSFFGQGLVGHVNMAVPVCPRLTEALAAAAEDAGIPIVRGRTYVCMEGPQFSTAAESRLHKSWGAHVVGMTNMPEAKLAREAELPYATVAMVTDADSWATGQMEHQVADILAVLRDNAARGKALIAAVAPRLGPARTPSPLDIEHELDRALITAPEVRDPDVMARLDAVAGRALGIPMRGAGPFT